MRLDKYLKITRLIKRRTVANEACDGGRILVNGKVARASYAVKEGDTIEIQMGNRPLKVQVLSVSEYATKESAAQMYRVFAPIHRFCKIRQFFCNLVDRKIKRGYHIVINKNSLIKSDRGDRPCEVRQPAKRRLCKVPNPAGKPRDEEAMTRSQRSSLFSCPKT